MADGNIITVRLIDENCGGTIFRTQGEAAEHSFIFLTEGERQREGF